MIKLVISDIDGTLVANGKSISKENLAAIDKLHKNNIEFGVATGRDYIHAKDTLKDVNLELEYLCCSGAQYYDKKENIIMEHLMESKQVAGVVDVLNRTNIAHMIVTSEGLFSLNPDRAKEEFLERVKAHFNPEIQRELELENMPFMNVKVIEDLDSWLSDSLKVIKFEIFSLDADLLQTVKDQVRNINDIVALSSFEDNVEITHIDAQKGVILEKVAKLKGLNKDEIAIVGDSYNDISMFELFDYSFAPNSGIASIKDKAFHVTCSCEEHGFAAAVDYILDSINKE
ncbi:MAG: Cof-type HAD-IIB family hydrolase [Erysipelotrichaceae bacterium]|nr:Cof-type HAD-IIB family hydrolase [Erysipelotrichaceae bacterium]MDD3810123.1 Cof-type HAD-IIB family hydrolase [Erysipelotrichaceae bacterium]